MKQILRSLRSHQDESAALRAIRMTGCRAVALLGLAVAGGCDAWLTKPSLYNAVTVIASRRNGEPIPGVGLTLYTGQRPIGYATTGADGRFTFTQVPQGLYGVAITVPDGYEAIENVHTAPPSLVVAPLKVADDTLSPVRFTLLKRGPGIIVARVVQPDGTPISGATVEAYEPGKIDSRATTGADGNALFPSVPFGIHGLVLTRPAPYRDFRTAGDSLYAFHDDLIVEDGIRDSVVFVLAKCTGTIRALVQDETGAPISGANMVFYVFGQQLGIRASGADGRVNFTEAPCVVQVGVSITAPLGYTVTEGRNSSFFDGLTLSSGGARDVTFRLRKLP